MEQAMYKPTIIQLVQEEAVANSWKWKYMHGESNQLNETVGNMFAVVMCKYL
jgi:hypothetical protein